MAVEMVSLAGVFDLLSARVLCTNHEIHMQILAWNVFQRINSDAGEVARIRPSKENEHPLHWSHARPSDRMQLAEFLTQKREFWPE